MCFSLAAALTATMMLLNPLVLAYAAPSTYMMHVGAGGCATFKMHDVHVLQQDPAALPAGGGAITVKNPNGTTADYVMNFGVAQLQRDIEGIMKVASQGVAQMQAQLVLVCQKVLGKVEFSKLRNMLVNGVMKVAYLTPIRQLTSI